MAIDLNKLAAQRRAAMDDIFIDNPRAREAYAKFEFLMEHARCNASRGKMAMTLFADSASGKTSLLDNFAASKNTPQALAERRIPVLIVTLEANTTRKGLAQNILEAIAEYG